MLGEFMYHNPTTLYFGSQSLENLDRELPLYGPNVLLVYDVYPKNWTHIN